MKAASSSDWTEIRLIGSLTAVEGVVRILAASGADIATDTGTRPAREGKDGQGKDGKVRRYLVARLASAPAVQEASDGA